MRRCSAVLLLLTACAVNACRGAAVPKSDYVDKLPPPEEPLVMQTGEMGSYGGRFVVVTNTPPATFNPVVATTSASGDVINRMFILLTRFDWNTQEVLPGLATSWELSPDGLSATFHLRHGARFSDGHPITADDVVFSFAVINDPAVAASARDVIQMNGQPLAVTAPDPHTVIIRSPSPNGSLLVAVGAVSILPKHVLEPVLQAGTFNTAYGLGTPPEQLVTSGPWRLQQQVGNEKTVLTRNPFWFGVDAKGQRLPYLDELVFLIAPDQDAADLKFRGGEADALPIPAPANYEWYAAHQAEGQFTLHDLGPLLSPTAMFFNLNERAGATKVPVVGPVKGAWFSNRTFRRAVSAALDRVATIRSVYYGEGVKYWAMSTPADKHWALPDIAHDDYDPSRAKQMLASIDMRDRNNDGIVEDATGHDVVFSLKVAANNQMRVAMVNFIRDDLAKLAIKLLVAPVDLNALMANINNDFQYDAAIAGFGRGLPDPITAMNIWRSSGFHPWHPRERTPDSPEQARVDWLVDHIMASTDFVKRKAWWAELHRINNEQGWMIWLPVPNQKIPIRNRFGNVRPSGLSSTATAVVWNAEEFFLKPQGRATD